jgi:hypothetical protein
MPISRNTLDNTRNIATRALDAKIIDQKTFDALTDGHITAKESAAATWVMTKKAIFGGADKKAAASALAKAIEQQMVEQGGG